MSRKSEKLTQIIQSCLANTVSKIQNKDQIITVTGVRLSPDYKSAHVWLNNLKNKDWNVSEIKKYLPEFIEDLKKAELRNIPKLTFYKDSTGEYTEKIDNIIDKIHES